MRIAHFDCFSGISGDMTLGALFGAGRNPTAVLWLDVASESFVTSTSFAAPASSKTL